MHVGGQVPLHCGHLGRRCPGGRGAQRDAQRAHRRPQVSTEPERRLAPAVGAPSGRDAQRRRVKRDGQQTIRGGLRTAFRCDDVRTGDQRGDVIGEGGPRRAGEPGVGSHEDHGLTGMRPGEPRDLRCRVPFAVDEQGVVGERELAADHKRIIAARQRRRVLVPDHSGRRGVQEPGQ